MKKLLSLTLAMMMAFSVTAFGATTIDEVDKNKIVPKNDVNKYDVTFTEGVEDDNEYMLWAINGLYLNTEGLPAFDTENVLYVNQVTAVNNSVSFTNFLPKDDALDATLLISGRGMSGQGMDGLKIAGYIAGATVVTLGDVDGDGDVDQTDAQLLLAYVLQAKSETELDISKADMTGDGKYDMDDVVAIMKTKAE